MAKQAQHDSCATVVTYRIEIQIRIDDVIGTIAIEFHGLVLANGSALGPEDLPGIAPGIVDVEVYIDHF